MTLLQVVEREARLVAQVAADCDDALGRDFDPRIDVLEVRAGDLVAELLLQLIDERRCRSCELRGQCVVEASRAAVAGHGLTSRSRRQNRPDVGSIVPAAAAAGRRLRRRWRVTARTQSRSPRFQTYAKPTISTAKNTPISTANDSHRAKSCTAALAPPARAELLRPWRRSARRRNAQLAQPGARLAASMPSPAGGSRSASTTGMFGE